MRSLWLVGAGGLGREAADAAAVAGVEVAGFVDDRPLGSVAGYRVVSPDEVAPGWPVLVAVGDGAVRERLAATLEQRGAHPVSLAHPAAQVASGASIGPGSLVLAGAFVSVSVELGEHCQVHYTATIGHDCVLGRWVTVLPGANVSGSVRCEDGVTVGAGAVVLPGLRLGRGSFVGAGAVVTRDVPPGTVVVGSPARPLR